MVARINTSNSLNMALNYNEQKVKQKKAECIMAVNYPKDLNDLNFYAKLNRFKKLTSLNENTKRNSLHISLNFHPSEKLDRDKLEQIATTYIEKIGFGKQPYLVYEHNDAGHPHIHIITTNIQADGKRIELHNIGRNQSEKARKEIEKQFSLIKAEGRKQIIEKKEVNNQRIHYGKSETMRAITNVLDTVIDQYKYTSLPELNAVLRLYSVTADRGKSGSRVYENKGLLYRILDEKGNKIGVPVKASLIYSKPTLKYLEKKFITNEILRQEHKKRLKNTIDWSFLKKPTQPLASLIESLSKERIHVCIRQNEQGIIYGVTYIDHLTKCVFNGSDLGKQYSAKGLLEKCREKEVNNSKNKMQLPEKNIATAKDREEIPFNREDISFVDKITDMVMTASGQYAFVPYALKRKKKKQRRS
ncbi:MAG: relaxase [Bacteroidetes bacterium]|nr:MAG: relaxase [Bacteroidota bacterium]